MFHRKNKRQKKSQEMLDIDLMEEIGYYQKKPQKKGAEDTITLFDFLNGLSDEQQKAAFAHLKLKWDRVQGSGLYGRS